MASAWPRRLWTLQEGAVARRLFFQFADGAAELEELLRDAGVAVEADDDDQNPRRPTSAPAEESTTSRPRRFSPILRQILFFGDDLKSPDTPSPFPLSSTGGGGGVVMSRHRAKTALRRQLRLCLLALPRFRGFASEEEKLLGSALRRRLGEMYPVTGGVGDDVGDGGGEVGLCDPRTARMRRLRGMLELDWSMATIRASCYKE